MKINVNTSLPIQFTDTDNESDSRYTQGKVWICHTGLNLNNSSMSKPVIEKAANTSLANTPIFGFIKADTVGENDFKGHEQRIVIDENGIKIEYLGSIYGIVPESNNAKFEKKICDDGVEREFLTAEVLMFNKMTAAHDIINRDLIKNQSMELHPPSIKGSFKDGVFEFSEFKFEGLCLLGDDVNPAMRGSIFEAFSTQSNKENLKKVVTEFNTYFAEFESKEKGVDTRMKDKQELFSKFDDIAEVDILRLKEDIENYTYEELETELIKLAEDHSNNNSFSLTAKQFEKEIRNALSNEKFTDKWGDSYRAYWYIDHDNERVYVEDNQDNNNTVGLNYSISGDQVTIDFFSKKRVKFVPQDMEDEATATTVFVSQERNEHEKVSLNKELVELSTEFESLKEFKIKQENNEKLETIALFTDLSKEDTQQFVDNLHNFSKEDLELQLFALRGKKASALDVNQKKENLVFSLAYTDEIDGKSNLNVPEWVEYVEQYKAKHNK